MNVSEGLGLVCGYPLGVLTGTISFIRAARMFHPRGILATAKVTATTEIQLPETALIRFSSAWWKNKEWRDVLGISIRFADKQDLLFASFKYPWQTPAGPFLTAYHDFSKNNFYAVSPFLYEGKTVFFKLICSGWIDKEGDRETKLLHNICAGSSLSLLMKEKNQEWIKVAEIKLVEQDTRDQERMKFDPFLNGLGIYPKGFIQYLRVGAYRLSQLGRSLR